MTTDAEKAHWLHWLVMKFQSGSYGVPSTWRAVLTDKDYQRLREMVGE